MRERGLKHTYMSLQHKYEEVAPHAGAWIETLGIKLSQEEWESLPMRERGLKPAPPYIIRKVYYVAPHAGAWIETRP